MQRLFLALWPDAAVRAALAEVQAAVLPAGVRAVAPEKLHLTLAFLGNPTAAARGCLERRLAGVAPQPFTLRLDTVDWWPRAGVVWIGPRVVPAALLDLQAACAAHAAACGIALERRPFRPHVTLARRGRSPRRAAAWTPVEWTVGRLYLVESTTGPGGGAYRLRAAWPPAD